MIASRPGTAAPRKVITVSGQIAGVVAVGLSIAFLLVIALEIQRFRSVTYAAQLHNNIHIVQLIAGQLYVPLTERKLAVIVRSYDSLTAQKDMNVVAVLALDRDGKVVTSYRDPAVPIDLQAILQSDGFTRVDHGGTSKTVGDLFVVSVPVLSADGDLRGGTLAMAWDLSDLRRATAAETTREVAIALVTLAVFITLALVYVRLRLGKPLAEITRATNRIANGDKSFEVPWTGRRDEIGDMARSLVTFRENVALIDRLTAEQQQQTMRLSEALEKERQYNALHREFVSMVSHEFRTPVAIIDGAAQRIDRRAGKDTPNELRQRTTKIRGAVRRMVELIDSTLSLSRIEAGTIDLELEDCDLAALLRDVCQRHQEIADEHKISLIIADLPPSVRLDPHRMDQIFTNLLSNAVKYSPGAPRIDVKAGMVGNQVVVAVRDRGLGIPKAELPKLFEKFFRASTSTGIPGTGIGLHLVRHLVELHGGSVAVDSAEGGGTTVSITLPVTAGNRDDAETHAVQGHAESVMA